MTRFAWRILPALTAAASGGPDSIPPLLRHLLHNRGVESGEMEAFLEADGRLEADPFALPDMDRAVNRIHRARFSGETIAVYGDFDADGITATALLVEALSAIGAPVIPYIPDRATQGYGLRFGPMEQLRRQGVSLVVTCDCGTSANGEIEQATQAALDVIVTDHHLPPASLPRAHAVVNPRRNGSAYPCPELAGVGVAFKLVQALVWGCGGRDLTDRLLDLVALGTVADMSPLIGENRYLVKRGIEVLNNTERPGLQELMRSAGLQPGKVDADGISWALAPRINAAGRLDRAIPSYDLLVTRVRQEAMSLASALEQKNAERQRLTREVLDKARARITGAGTDLPVLIACDDDYPSGVVGIVAGRLVNEFYRPVFILKTGADVCRGSGRSIPEFNLVHALEECSDLLLEFGGHSGAAGFVVPAANLGALRDRLSEVAARQLSGLDLRPSITVDAEVSLQSLGWDLYNTVHRLAPFGAGNPVPTFLSRRVKVVDSRTMGRGEHLRLRVRDGAASWQAVAFGFGDAHDSLAPYLDIVYNFELDRWGGEEMLRLNLLDLAPAA